MEFTYYKNLYYHYVVSEYGNSKKNNSLWGVSLIIALHIKNKNNNYYP